MLMAARADVHTELGYKMDRAVHIAAAKGHSDAVAVLLTEGATVNDVDSRCCSCYCRLCELLVGSCIAYLERRERPIAVFGSTQTKTPHCNTPLHRAADM